MRYYTNILMILAAFGLNGCSNVKNSLGLDKTAPDEFAVLTRAPLEIPESLGALPPPNLGAPRPQEVTAKTQAQEALLGSTPTTQATASKSESILLKKAGTENTVPNIRATVNKETAELHDRNKPVVEKLLNVSGHNKRPSATIVDSKKELERIQANKEAGKNITDGETPVIED